MKLPDTVGFRGWLRTAAARAREAAVHRLRWLRAHFFGWKDTSEQGSNYRRAFSRFSLALACLVGIELTLQAVFCSDLFTPGQAGVWFAALWPYVYFVTTVLAVFYLAKDNSFVPDARRLLGDLAISSATFLMCFGLVFRGNIEATSEGMGAPTPIDALYFAVVVFSTLGFGDFRPAQDHRLAAAALAFTGAMHLGLVAGAFFYALQVASKGRGV